MGAHMFAKALIGIGMSLALLSANAVGQERVSPSAERVV